MPRDTGKIIAEAVATLDFTRPVAVLLLGILPFIPDEDGPWEITSALMGAVAPGSYLAVSHWASDIRAGEAAEAGSRYNENSAVPLRLRSQAEFTRFFDGLELTGGPGIVPVKPLAARPAPNGQQEEKEALPGYAAPAVSRAPADDDSKPAVPPARHERAWLRGVARPADGNHAFPEPGAACAAIGQQSGEIPEHFCPQTGRERS
jgi:hypothetical protein